MTDNVSYELDGSVAVIRLDDGKANAISHDVVAGIDAALDQASMDNAGAVALVGRPGRFSAGFDLTTMKAGPQQARDLLEAGARLAIRIYGSSLPVVTGVTGHALAMGAILLLAADTRIGADGDYKIGLNEVAIGMPVPMFAVVLAGARLSPRHLTPAVNHAKVFDPEGAVEAGYLDSVVDPEAVVAAAIAHAHTLADRVVPSAFAATRSNLRGDTISRLNTILADDIAAFEIAV